MIRYSVNLGFLFTEVPFLERFGAARSVGFDAVEFAWPLVDDGALRLAVAHAGVRVVQMNMDAGDLAAGERGWASHRNAVPKWRAAFAAALELATMLDCPRINVLAGNAVPGESREDMLECLTDNLRWALPLATAAGRTLLLEVLNSTDTPAYLFTDTASTAAFLGEIGDPALRLQFDAYHVASGGEAPSARFTQLAPLIGHVQLADFPGRHEPGTGTTDFPRLLAAIEKSAYDGYVGLEYVPSSATLSSLAWLPFEQRG